MFYGLVVHPSILEMLTHNRRMEPLAQPRLVARLDLMLCCGTVIVSVNLNAMRIMRAKRARQNLECVKVLRLRQCQKR